MGDFVLPISEKQQKINEATKGLKNIPLGPKYVDKQGNKWKPKQGKLWKLINKDDEQWPGTPDDNNKFICFHDSYSFKGIPWGIALDFNEIKNIFIMFEGHFCSPNCVLSFINSSKLIPTEKAMMFTSIYFTKVMNLKIFTIINRAPPPFLLKRFQPKTGLDIKEYRKDFINSLITVLPNNLVSPITLIEQIQYEKDLSKKRKIQKTKFYYQQKIREKNFQNNPKNQRIKKNITCNIRDTNSILNLFKKQKKKL